MVPCLAALLLAAAPEVPSLLKDLGSDDFSTRQEASRVLSEHLRALDRARDLPGLKEAMAAVREAAASGDPEVRERAGEALRPYLAGGTRWEAACSDVNGLRCASGRLYAWGAEWMACYEAGTGKEAWRLEKPALPAPLGKVQVSEAGIYAAGKGWVGRIDPKDGRLLWTRTPPEGNLRGLEVSPCAILAWGHRYKMEKMPGGVTKSTLSSFWVAVWDPDGKELLLKAADAFPPGALHETRLGQEAVFCLGFQDQEIRMLEHPFGEDAQPRETRLANPEGCRSFVCGPEGVFAGGVRKDKEEAWLGRLSGKDPVWERAVPGIGLQLLQRLPQGILAGGWEAGRKSWWLGLYDPVGGKPVWERSGLPTERPRVLPSGILLATPEEAFLLGWEDGKERWRIPLGEEPASPRGLDADPDGLAAGGKGWIRIHRLRDADRP